MLFKYKTKNFEGETIKGTIEAISQQAATDILTNKKLIILSLVEAGAVPFWRRPLNIPFLSGVKPQDMVFLSRQLATMVGAGLPLVKALEVLNKQTANTYLKGVVQDIAEEVRGGNRFSSTLAKYPKLFDNFFINMVRAGETAGKLDEVLNYLADEQEKNFDLMSKMKGAMIYPAFVVAMVGGVMVLMMVFVIPQLTTILEEAGVELPITTRILIGTSKFFKKYLIFIILAIIGLVVGFKFFTKTKSGRFIWDRTILKAPVFGKLFQNLYLVRFTRSLSTLIVGGIPLTSALKIVSDVVGNAVYKKLVLRTIKDVEEGRSISSALLESKQVPKMLSHLLAVGERTGKIDEVLSKMADFYSREVENILSRLVTLLEPIIIIFLGVVVGGMVASIILPMYRLASAF